MTELSVDPLCRGVIVAKATHREVRTERDVPHLNKATAISKRLHIDDIGPSIMKANGKHKRDHLCTLRRSGQYQEHKVLGKVFFSLRT